MLQDFDPTKYKMTQWRIKVHQERIIIFSPVGRRKEYLFCSVLPDLSKGQDDTSISQIKEAFKYYAFPSADRFRGELELVLSDVYQTKIIL